MKTDKILLVPTILLSKKEVENLNTKKVPKTYIGALNCNAYHLEENSINKYLFTETSANRALALRIVAKSLALKGSSSEMKASLLSVAASLMAAGCEAEADRLVRNV